MDEEQIRRFPKTPIEGWKRSLLNAAHLYNGPVLGAFMGASIAALITAGYWCPLLWARSRRQAEQKYAALKGEIN